MDVFTSLEQLLEGRHLNDIMSLDKNCQIILPMKNRASYVTFISHLVCESYDDHSFLNTLPYFIGMMKEQKVSFWNEPSLYKEATFSAIYYHVMMNKESGADFVKAYQNILKDYSIPFVFDAESKKDLLDEIRDDPNLPSEVTVLKQEKYIEDDLIDKVLFNK